MEYEEMLKKARENLPQPVAKSERFEIPKVEGHIQGNRTIISNFVQIANALGREPDHLLKYILKELATPGEIKKNNTAIIGRKVNSAIINEKIEKYANEFVICPVCRKPDTKLIEEDKIISMHCLACGTKTQVKSLII